MVSKHVSTDYSSTDVYRGACFYRKNALQHEALNQVYFATKKSPVTVLLVFILRLAMYLPYRAGVNKC